MAQVFTGWNVALKPAYEPVLCFRKPRAGTYAATALRYGTGALAVEAGRVGTESTIVMRDHVGAVTGANGIYGPSNGRQDTGSPAGRWPANLLHDGSPDVLAAFARAGNGRLHSHWSGRCVGFGEGREAGKETNKVYDNSEGTASRFFACCPPDAEDDEWRLWYCAKAGRRERDAGLEGWWFDGTDISGGGGVNTEKADAYQARKTSRHNPHPMVKPLSLTRYLARLILPPEPYRDEAALLVPFAGVASEMIGAALAGWRNVTGIELDAEYCAMGRARLDWWQRLARETGETEPAKILAKAAKLKEAPLLALAEAAT